MRLLDVIPFAPPTLALQGKGQDAVFISAPVIKASKDQTLPGVTALFLRSSDIAAVMAARMPKSGISYRFMRS